jgi:hypothetical protein
MTAYPRVDQNGHLVPELSDWLRGYREAQRLQAEGIAVDTDQVNLTRLGKALADAMPPMTPEQRAELIAQAKAIESRARIEQALIIKAMDAGTFREWKPDWMLALERDARTPPELHPETAEDNPNGENGGVDHVQGGSRVRQRRGKPRVRSVSYVDNARKNPMQDDDDD